MSFSGKIRKFNIEAIKATQKVKQGVAVELFTSVISDTPVDTGRARGNWQSSESVPKGGTVDRLDPSGTSATAEVMAAISIDASDKFMTNNLPYVNGLEEGRSRKAPAGMVRKNIARVRRILAAQVRKHRI